MSEKETWFTFPEPLSINHKYVGRSFALTKEYRSYKENVARICRRDLKGKKYIEPTNVHITWFRKIRRGDADNVIKPILDGMTLGGVWDSDSILRDIRISRDDTDKKNPRVLVKVNGFVVDKNTNRD